VALRLYAFSAWGGESGPATSLPVVSYLGGVCVCRFS